MVPCNQGVCFGPNIKQRTRTEQKSGRSLGQRLVARPKTIAVLHEGLFLFLPLQQRVYSTEQSTSFGTHTERVYEGTSTFSPWNELIESNTETFISKQIKSGFTLPARARSCHTHLMSLHRRSKATSGGFAVKQPTHTAPHTSRTEFSESRSTSMGGMRVVHPFTC